MDKVRSSFAGALVAALIALSTSAVVASSHGADAALATHPSVGSWVIRIEGAPDPLGLAKLSADGTAHLSADSISVGAWVPTGPRTAEVIFVESQYPTIGFITMDAQLMVSDDGQTVSGDYAVSPAGSDSVPTISVADDLVRTSLFGERVPDPVAPRPFEGCAGAVRFC